MYAIDHVIRSVLGDYPYHDPPAITEQLMAPDVLDVLPAVAAMLVTVVFGGHLELLPAHIEKGDRGLAV
jgi:hypothetical protein